MIAARSPVRGDSPRLMQLVMDGVIQAGKVFELDPALASPIVASAWPSPADSPSLAIWCFSEDAARQSMDLTDVASSEAAMHNINKSGRQVDTLVNNAGVLHEKPLLDPTDAELAGSIAVHLAGPLWLVRLGTPTSERAWSRRKPRNWWRPVTRPLLSRAM